MNLSIILHSPQICCSHSQSRVLLSLGYTQHHPHESEIHFPRTEFEKLRQFQGSNTKLSRPNMITTGILGFIVMTFNCQLCLSFTVLLL